MAFLDPTVPIATCDASDCTDCPVAESIHCHFRPEELAHFLLICMPAFFVGGIAVVWGYPIPFFAVGGMWLLLALYLLLTAGFFVTLKMFLCSQCMNFACPLNGVPEPIRTKFFERNPIVGRAWTAHSMD